MLELRCEFPDTAKFHAKYQRNNKRTGLKNLRCYPFCGPDDTHHENGFCGASVRANVTVSGGSAAYDVSKLLAWGELISKSEKAPRFPLGTTFTKSEIKRILRTDTNHLNPLFESQGAITGPNERQFCFESQKKGWHYEWRGNKYTSDKPHAFVVYTAVPFGVDTFHCVGVFYSPVFTMFCRRRHKTVPEAEKTQMAASVPLDERVCKLPLLPDGKCIVFDRPAVVMSPPGSASRGQANGGGEDDSSGDEEGSSMLSDDEDVKPQKRKSSSSTAPRKRVSSSAGAPARLLLGSGSKRPRSSSGGLASAPSSSSKKVRPDRDGTDLKLMRVLAAIGNVDKLKRRLHLDSEKTRKNSTSTPGTSMSTTDDELDMAWLDALAGTLQDSFLGSEDFMMPFKGGSVDDIFDMGEQPRDQEDLNNQERVRAVEVVDALAKFFVEEESFTQAIHETAAHRASYAEFLQLVHKQINDLLRERYNGMTVDSLDAALRGETVTASVNEVSDRRGMKSAFETLVSAALMRGEDELMDRATVGVVVPPKIHSLSSSPSNEGGSIHHHNSSSHMTASTGSPPPPQQQQQPWTQQGETAENGSPRIAPVNKPIQLPPGMVLHDLLRAPKPLRDDESPDVAGVWMRPESNTAEMEKWRERRDMDWVQRQMLAKMERRFEFEQLRRGEVTVKLSRKLLSSGVVTYLLDGVERPFGLLSPLGPGTNLAKTGCAWAIGPCVCIRNAYSDAERLTRVVWKVGEDELHGVHIYEARGGGAWEDGQDAELDAFPISEDGWKAVHLTMQICTRDKSMPPTSRAVTSTSSEAEDA